MSVFERLESSTCSYARNFPVTFDRAVGSHLYDRRGRQYFDFLSGAGALNYGHNHPVLKRALLEYIERDGVAQGLDMHTRAKEAFLDAFHANILAPRQMRYVVQFTGPTGANAVEAALKIARNVTGRHNVIAFTNAFHGVSLGAASTTGNGLHRNAAGIPQTGVTRALFDGYLGGGVDTIEMLDRLICDGSSGVDPPAAAIVETIQSDGLNAASYDWLRSLERLCRRHGMLLIVDDVQAGCGRTGAFFSFELAGIRPDIVTLSRSLSGYGLPLAVVLLKRDHDSWKPGEHNGTFRGNNHAFVTARAAFEHFWRDSTFASEVRGKGTRLRDALLEIVSRHPGATVKGRGMMLGLELESTDVAREVCANAFTKGLLIEPGGADGRVVKCLCPLVIDVSDLERAVSILSAAVDEVQSAAGPLRLNRLS